jgi:hypothetical protein
MRQLRAVAYSPITGDKWTDEAERKWRPRLRNQKRQGEEVDGEFLG